MIKYEELITLMFDVFNFRRLGLLSVWAMSGGVFLITNAWEPVRAERPNILFAIADDWGWHAGAYGDEVVKTPTFDQLAADGVLFTHAFVSSPSCTPSRAAIVTGQYHWRLKQSANLYGPLQHAFPVYPDLLKQAGYHVGSTRKGWGPGQFSAGGRDVNPAGKKYKNLQQFLDQRPDDAPFCFWFGSYDPHRGYEAGVGKASGIDIDKIDLPACFPDSQPVRADVADYYWEVQRFDREVGELIEQLRDRQLLENTIIVMTGDHGMPFPRCKGNLYDSGVRVPLVIRCPDRFSPGRRSADFVSLIDLAPTFLELADVRVPAEMTGRSLAGRLLEDEGYQAREFIMTGKERHVPGQERTDSGGTPMRSIRDQDYLLIKNFRPDRWPAGTPNHQVAFLSGAWYADVDNGPTKNYMIDNRNLDDTHQALFNAAFAKRPAMELYDLKKDPDQLRNVAEEAAYADVVQRLEEQLMGQLIATQDPRVSGNGEQFDSYPYTGGAPKFPKPARNP